MASADFDLCYLTATEAMRSIARFKSKKPSPVETDERRALARCEALNPKLKVLQLPWRTEEDAERLRL